MARPTQELSVTYRFTVELTDHLEACFGATLMTRDAARAALDHVLYEGDKHQAFTLRLIGEAEDQEVDDV
ncbi:hypothetical protein OG978_32865 [Streptomyces sp. NBC_01591]|uniref:hypothetical protein n=1 Tax=Streptomyces sp. NBC_01591 TaxID=2975888 RepID=UPI002DD8CAE3|nr:hypothetical protein [Streptomyces sp. NBC_01591]WSD71767.1 hypothetical protein OG978_32865 [Streptomyces sp. NBC_01591]